MEKTSKKGPPLRAWIRDRMVFLAIIIFVFGAGAYIGSVQVFDHDSIWLHPVKEFSLLIAMIGVVSLGYELFIRELTFNEYKEALQEIVNPDAVRLGVNGIYKNRSELGQAVGFERLFKNVKKEVFIGGSSLLSISTGSRDLIREKVLNGINVKLLMMDPDSEVAQQIQSQQGQVKQTFINEIRTSILLLQKLQEEIEDQRQSSKGSMIIHTYDTIPSHSFISVDAQDSTGIIIADIGPYLGRNHQRPSMMVVSKKHGLYDHYRDLNDVMWKESKPLSLASEKPAGPKTKTQVFVSGPETEYYDRESESWASAPLCEVSDNWQGVKGSQWVWVRDKITLEEAKTGSQHKFRLNFDIPPGKAQTVNRAELFVRSDDTCHITVNDVSLKQEYGGAEYPQPFIINFDQYLQDGMNTVTFEVINYAMPNASNPEDNPSGLIYRLHLEMQE